MSLTDTLVILVSVATAVERLAVLVKPLFLTFKSMILKKEIRECTKVEKIVITIILGILLCISLGIGLDVPDVKEPFIVQCILAGLISSFGSNALHIILSLLAGIKDSHEVRTSVLRNTLNK